MTGWKHRRRPNYRHRYAVGLIVASFTLIAVGSWRQVSSGGQPITPTTTTNPADGFHAPPRMPLGTRPTKAGPS